MSTFLPAVFPTSNSTRVRRLLKWAVVRIGESFSIFLKRRVLCRRSWLGAVVKKLIEQGKTTSIRGLYYLLKHTIAGTKEHTFDDQGDCDPIIEDVEVTLDSLREELHLYASNRGNMMGDLTLIDNGVELNCSRVGRNGYSIPSIVEPDIVKFVKHNAKFILHVEKDTVFSRFVEDEFWKKHKCILTHGSGQPPRGVRRLLNRMHKEFKLPIYCLLDNDPWGYLHLQCDQAGVDQPGV